MSRLWARFAGYFGNRTLAGVDKAGNRYFTRTEELDGIMKEKRWVIFKAEDDPTSIPVEWICWLNGQRKKAPTSEVKSTAVLLDPSTIFIFFLEMAELEAKRERVRLNVALLKKEEEERRAKEVNSRSTSTGKVGGPDLRSFIKQFPVAPEGDQTKEQDDATIDTRVSGQTEADKKDHETKQQPELSEPTGSGTSFRPGTWQPPP